MATTATAQTFSGARVIPSHGYEKCVEITNGKTRVIVDPNAGGRVLSYQLNGNEVIQQDPSHNGWTVDKSPRPEGHICGGRFDIGPPLLKPNTDLFFFGKWNIASMGKMSVKIISQLDTVSLLQLVREFKLDENTSQLKVTQTIINKSTKPIKTAFWGRTFAQGNGICFMPIEEPSRFPKKYIVYGPGRVMDFEPIEPEVSVNDGYLIMYAPPTRAKFVMDVSHAGWIGYLTQSNSLFVKTFDVDNTKVYSEMASANTSIWYNGTQMTEIEPMSPWEWIKPNKSSSFTENWYIYDYQFPTNRRDFTTQKIKEIETKYHLTK